MNLPPPLTEDQEDLVKDAQDRVRKIMFDLSESLSEHGLRLDSMEIDTREFAGLRVSIFTRPIQLQRPPTLSAAKRRLQERARARNS